MKRKINLVGQNTLTVSLPSKWAEKHNIKKGDEIELIEDKENLTISINKEGKEKKLKEIEINLSAEEWRHIRLILGGIYKKGFDVVKIKYPSEKAFKLIQESVNNLMGYEIFENGSDYCIIKSMILESEDELKNATNRFIHSIKTIRTIVREDYVTQEYKRYEETVNYRNTGWKFRDYSMRLGFNKLQDSPSKHGFIIVIWTLEKINRNYMKIYESMQQKKAKTEKETIIFYDKVSDYFDFLTKIIHSPELKDIEKLNDHYNQLMDKGMKLIDKTKNDAQIIAYLIENVRRIQDLSSNLILIHF